MGLLRSVAVLFLSAIFICCLATSEEANIKNKDVEDRWWYAPSRRAHLHAHKYQAALNNLNRLAQEREVQMRLPTDVLPISYDIRLLPIIEEGNFTTHGHIEIHIKCVTATNKILLNAADLKFTGPMLVAEKGTTNYISGVYDDKQNTTEIVTLLLNTQLLAGREYVITINFIAKLNDELRGFYRSSYEENGVKKWLAVSQMEAPDARRSFPCFDEPSMKAEFKITLGRKKGMKAISNMPLEKSTDDPTLPADYIWDSFKTSVKMSTYLVAFMVSEFAKVPSPTGLSTTDFAIWARPDFQHQTNYSAYLGPMVLDYYVKDYFNSSFPLPKVDMAAIPDFAAGAMENWGLITYREADLLYDPRLSSASAKQRVAIIIAHELAHQWFGNLVTMEWWNVLWLNEGFASYMEYPGTHAVEPGMEMNEQFTVTDLHYVFGIDALESSRPIDYAVNTPDEINQMFDAISYEKGSCIIRMCANFMTEPVFRKGIRRYLEDNAFDNTVQDDLWTALQAVATSNGITLPTTVKVIMDSWTSQMGYPVINVTRNYDAGLTALVSQQRFLLFKSPTSTDSNVYRWYVPLTFTSDFSAATSPIQWLEKQESRTITLNKPNDKWVIFNVGQEGYYRVLYDERNLELIKTQLMTEHEKISKKNRAQILDDYLNSARAGLVAYPTALELTRYLNKERDYAPWTAASVALDFIDIMLYGSEAYKSWKDYLIGPISSLYNYVTFNESAADSHLKNFTRSTAVNWACLKLEHQDCITSARKAYGAWIENPENDYIISPNLRRLISCTAMAFGSDADFQFGYSQYMDSTMANEKTDMLRAITCPRDRYILFRLLNEMINPNGEIRLQDTTTLFRGIASNPAGHEVAMDFITNQWDDVYNYFKSYEGFGGGTMSTLFRALCDRVNNQEKLNKLKKIYEDHKAVLGNSKSVRQGLELAEANVQWVGRNYQTITAWLKSEVTTTISAPTTTTTTTSAIAETTRATTTTDKPNNAPSSYANSNLFFLTMTLFVLQFQN